MIWIGIAIGLLLGAVAGIGWVVYQLGKGFHW